MSGMVVLSKCLLNECTENKDPGGDSSPKERPVQSRGGNKGLGTFANGRELTASA